MGQAPQSEVKPHRTQKEGTDGNGAGVGELSASAPCKLNEVTEDGNKEGWKGHLPHKVDSKVVDFLRTFPPFLPLLSMATDMPAWKLTNCLPSAFLSTITSLGTWNAVSAIH